jgi:hypothetical protein
MPKTTLNKCMGKRKFNEDARAENEFLFLPTAGVKATPLLE